MRFRGISGFLAMSLLAAVLAPVPGAAGDRDKGAPEAVRRAVEAGEIKSLADILAAVRGKLPGEVAGVEIERERGRWARSGEIERIKEK
jgi:uncharacterized membrane protein YkoI